MCYPHVPGTVRLFHLAGPPENYILARWHKNVGDRVRTGEIVATIESESVIAEFETFEDGVISKLCFSVEEAIPDGALLARITPSSSPARV